MNEFTIYVIEVWNVYGDPVVFTADSLGRAHEIAEEALKPYPIDVETGDRGYEITSTRINEAFQIS